MRLAPVRVGEAALGLGVLVLLVLLIVPWKEQALPKPAAADTSFSTLPPASLPAAPSPASPESILPIFIGRPAAQSAPVPAAKSPVEGTWLLYLGRSRAPDGTVTWFVKDTKTGKIIKAAKDEGADGWTMVEEKDNSLLLKNGGILYSVVKR